MTTIHRMAPLHKVAITRGRRNDNAAAPDSTEIDGDKMIDFLRSLNAILDQPLKQNPAANDVSAGDISSVPPQRKQAQTDSRAALTAATVAAPAASDLRHPRKRA